MTRGRRGFTIIELLTAMVVVGILASLALLKYFDVTNEAHAAQAAGDISIVRQAAVSYYAQAEEWPPGAPTGTVPAALQPLLPTGHSFVRQRYTVEWFNAGGGASPTLVAINIHAANARLAQKLQQRFSSGGVPFVMSGTTLSYILVAPGYSM